MPDRAVHGGDGQVGLEPLERAAPSGELTGSKDLRHAPDQAMAKRSAAAALFALDHDPAIEEWMIRREEPRPEVADLRSSERTEVRCGDLTISELPWGWGKGRRAA